MADRKPPRLARGEAETLRALLQYQRESLLRKVDGLDEESARWVLMHLLEETARHAGHADILRELIDGGTGRLPGSVRPGPVGSAAAGSSGPPGHDRPA